MLKAVGGGIATKYKTLQQTGTFKRVLTLPEGQKAIVIHIVFCVKHDGNGEVSKFKAQIVAKGFSQVYGQDFTEMFSSVAEFTTLQTLLSVIACKDWELHQVDVVVAYLCGNLKEELYMEIPEGVIVKGKNGGYWRLRKPLYGLKQAGWQWKTKLNEVMSKAGFKKSQADNCLYILRKDDEIIMLVLVYVDDMALTTKSITILQKFKDELSAKFEISDLGELRYILGIQVKQNRQSRTISLNQTAYIHQVLAQFGMPECAPVSTPSTTKQILSTSQSP